MAILFLMDSKIPAFLTCPICLDIFHSPKTSLCGHTFCSGCIDKWAKPGKKCPVCQGRLTIGESENFVLSDAIDDYVETHNIPYEKKAPPKRMPPKRREKKAKLEPAQDPFVTVDTMCDSCLTKAICQSTLSENEDLIDLTRNQSCDQPGCINFGEVWYFPQISPAPSPLVNIVRRTRSLRRTGRSWHDRNTHNQDVYSLDKIFF